MIQAIIDIGSNSIRLAIYKISEENEIKLLFNKKEIAKLAAYVVNGVMSNEGIEKACYILSDYKNLVNNLKIDNLVSFATAAIRNAKNSDDIVKNIENRTGIRITVLSGSEEARLGFAGAIKDINNNKGAMVDIGGGSTEIVLYEMCEIKHAFSLPIGAVNLTKLYVKGILPNKEECMAIEKAVLNEINKEQYLFSDKNIVIGGIGGTVRGACKIYNYLFKLMDYNKNIKADKIKEIIDLLVDDNTDSFISKKALHLLLNTVPERVETIVTGMVILNTLINYFHSELVILSESGVREGYIDKYILK